MTRREPKEEYPEFIAFRATPELADKIRSEAHADHRTVSGFLRFTMIKEIARRASQQQPS